MKRRLYSSRTVVRLLDTSATALTRLRAAVTRPVRATAFWLAVGLPWLVLALSFAGLVDQRPKAFGGLLAATLLVAVLGHDHER